MKQTLEILNLSKAIQRQENIVNGSTRELEVIMKFNKINFCRLVF